MSSSLLKEARDFAKASHDATGKIRKLSGKPYFTHPDSVASLLAQAGASPAVVVAGFLHDTTEDAGVTLDTIQDKFGVRVRELVAGASEPDKGATWDARKRHTIETLKAIDDQEILQLVVADKLDNLSDTVQNGGPDCWDKFNAPYEKQKWYYTTLARIFTEKIPTFPLTALYAALSEKVF